MLYPKPWSSSSWETAVKSDAKPKSPTSTPGESQATDAGGNVYQYKKLVWAADLKTLYRVADLASLKESKVIGDIETRKQALAGKVGGDSVLTLYLTVDLETAHFAQISSPHFFYTPSITGLSQVSLDELRRDDPREPSSIHRRQTAYRGVAGAVPGLHHVRNSLSRSQGCLTRAGGQDRAHHQLAVRLFADEAHRGDGLV